MDDVLGRVRMSYLVIKAAKMDFILRQLLLAQLIQLNL